MNPEEKIKKTLEKLLKKYKKKYPKSPYRIIIEEPLYKSYICSVDDSNNFHSYYGAPAVVWLDLGVEWYKHGKLHRENDLPADISKDMKIWYKEGKKHRENDKPAYIQTGKIGKPRKEWWYKGKRHRENDKPAVVFANGEKEYWFNGKRFNPNKNKIIKQQEDDLRRLGLIDSTLKEFINEMLSV